METATIDVVPSTIAPYNCPKVDEISCPSSDPVPPTEERLCCPSSDKKIMNTGHKLDSSSNINPSKDSPSKDDMVMGAYSRDPISKANRGDGDDDTQLCCPLPGSKLYRDSRADMHQLPLAAFFADKVHNDVAHTHEAPRSGDSVAETGVEESVMVDINTERTVYLPTVKQLPEITDGTENLLSEVGDNVSTVGEAKSEIIMECSYSTKGNRRGTLKKRLETHMVTCKASIL